MYTSPGASIYPRGAPEGAGLSRQTVIIIAVSCSVAGLILFYFLYTTIRSSCRSSNTSPLPPVQPLAHHREHHVARIEESRPRPQTWYQSDIPANHSLGSNASLLGNPMGSPFTPSTTSPSASGTEVGHELEPAVSGQTQHLPPPTPSYLGVRPGSSSSHHSSDASCTSPYITPLSPESFSSPLPRSITELRAGSSARMGRPLSMSSVKSYNTTNSRTSRHTLRALPHSPHGLVQIVLPTPLSSVNNSVESLTAFNSQHQSGSYHERRRSVADPWLLVSTTALAASIESLRSEEPMSQSRRRPRPASMSSLRSVLAKDESTIPPVPQLPTNWEMSQQTRSVSESQSRWVPSQQTVHEEDGETVHKKRNKLEKKRSSHRG